MFEFACAGLEVTVVNTCFSVSRCPVVTHLLALPSMSLSLRPTVLSRLFALEGCCTATVGCVSTPYDQTLVYDECDDPLQRIDGHDVERVRLHTIGMRGGL